VHACHCCYSVVQSCKTLQSWLSCPPILRNLCACFCLQMLLLIIPKHPGGYAILLLAHCKQYVKQQAIDYALLLIQCSPGSQNTVVLALPSSCTGPVPVELAAPAAGRLLAASMSSSCWLVASDASCYEQEGMLSPLLKHIWGSCKQLLKKAGAFMLPRD